MKKFFTIFCLSIVCFLGLTNTSSAFSGGDGSSGSPWQVLNWTELDTVRASTTAYYILTADLSSTTPDYTGLGSVWTPIGTNAVAFEGNFDGDGFTISDLTISTTTRNVGLFGFATGATFSNVGLLNINISGGYDVGGLVGYLNGGTTTNSYSKGTVVSTTASGSGSNVGGLVGYMDNSASVSGSYFSGIINANNFNVGGLVGTQYGGTVSNSSSTVNIITTISSGHWGYVGGLVGYQESGIISNASSTGTIIDTSKGTTGGLVGEADGLVSNLYSAVNVTGLKQVGGLVGAGSANISNSYTTGDVTGSDDYVGGLVGYQWSGLISNSYSTGTTTCTGGYGYVGGLVGEADGSISNSYSTGNVIAVAGTEVGGLVGESYSSVSNSYSTSNVTGLDMVGGLVGRLWDATISNSYSIGSILGSGDVGGLVGTTTGVTTVSNSFWDIDNSGKASSADGTGTTTLAMKKLSTFFDGTWDIGLGSALNNNYPYLSWQISSTSPVWLIDPYVLTYTLAYTAGANGLITGSSTQIVNSGADGTAVEAVPNTGYHFISWSDDSVSNPRTDTSASSSISVTASFATSSYLLSYIAGSGGTISGSSTQSVLFKSNGTSVTAVPNTGYHFVSWDDEATTTSRTDIATSSNQSFTASFTQNEVTQSNRSGGSRHSDIINTPTNTVSPVVSHALSTCSPYLTDYIKFGSENNIDQVKKLQTFLNTYEGTNLIVDGIYKNADVSAVKSFQLKYKDTVLDFWNIKVPSGYVYVSTLKAINRVHCEKIKGITCPYFVEPTSTKNNFSANEILKIRKFLVDTQNENISTTSSIFDLELTKAVERFQSKYSKNILTPWNIKTPTGLWYQSTRKYADELLGCYYPVRLANGVVVQ